MRGVPDFRISRLSSSVRPTGASGCVKLGIRRSRRCNSPSRRRSFSSSSATWDLSALPTSIKADRFSGSRSLPVAWAISFWRRRISSTPWSRLPALALELDRAVDVFQDVGGRVPVPAILFDRLGVGDHVLHVQHVTPFYCLTLFPKLCQQIGAGLDAAVEVGDRELLVRPVEVIVVLAPAQKQRVDAQLLLDQADDRNRAPLADEDRLGSETGLDRPDGGLDARAYRC